MTVCVCVCARARACACSQCQPDFSRRAILRKFTAFLKCWVYPIVAYLELKAGLKKVPDHFEYSAGSEVSLSLKWHCIHVTDATMRCRHVFRSTANTIYQLTLLTRMTNSSWIFMLNAFILLRTIYIKNFHQVGIKCRTCDVRKSSRQGCRGCATPPHALGWRQYVVLVIITSPQ